MNPTPAPLACLDRIPAGLAGAWEYEFLARRFIAAASYEYIAGGSGRDVTLAANLAAFAAHAIVPRLLRDVSGGHTRVTLLGRELAHPFLLAPLAHQRLAHPQGELETARGAAATDTCLVASTLSSFSLEDIARRAGPARWFQLYFQPGRAATLDLARRAEAAGYGALVVTLDAAVQAPSQRALGAGFRMPADCVPANLTGYPEPAPATLPPGQSRIFQGLMARAPGRDDLAWLLGETRLPVLVKGVLHPDDAVALRELGVAGVIVSNHGGRALDHAPASLSALPGIRAALGADYPVLLDGGIRSGGDAFKALALGADAVLVGRLQVYALAVAGALGVAHMLKLLREELELVMAQTGCATPADIGPEFLLT